MEIRFVAVSLKLENPMIQLLFLAFARAIVLTDCTNVY